MKKRTSKVDRLIKKFESRDAERKRRKTLDAFAKVRREIESKLLR